MPDPATPPVDHRALASSLEDLAAALDDNARDQRLLAGRIRYLRAGAARGKRWKDLLDGEPRPSALQLSSTILARLTEGSASLRRGLVRALRAEGATIPAIAEHFGVSHQRVSSMLRRSPEQTSPAAAASAPKPG